MPDNRHATGINGYLTSATLGLVSFTMRSFPEWRIDVADELKTGEVDGSPRLWGKVTGVPGHPRFFLFARCRC